MGHGGKRPGAGKPKGTKWKSTIDKLAARELARQMITARLEPLIEAQIANAQGIKYLVARDPKTGKFERIGPDGVTSEAVIEVWEKDPSVQAFSDLLNRALDKPKEQEQEIKLTGEAELIQRLFAGRKRAAQPRE